MTWFEDLTGFRETSPQQVRGNIVVDGETMTSRVNDRIFTYGRLETPSLGELRRRVARSPHETGSLSLREVVADVSDLHADESNAGALFQVAFQFNLLEMVSRSVPPERVGICECGGPQRSARHGSPPQQDVRCNRDERLRPRTRPGCGRVRVPVLG